MTPTVHLVYLAIALQTFVLALVFVPLARRLGQRFGFMDALDARKIHSKPMVRCGGVGIYLAFMVGLAADLIVARVLQGSTIVPEQLRPFAGNIRFVSEKLVAVVAGASLLFFTGLVDDRKPLGPTIKLGIQILSAVPLIMAGITVRFFIPGEIAGALLTIAWVVLLSNAFNFLDNMDGLSAGVAAVATFNFFLVSMAGREFFMMGIFALLFGAICGFLVFNFPRARLFMGDSGSLFIGYMLAALSILVTYYKSGVPTQLPVVAPLIILGVPIFDTASVMYIRWRAGAPLMKGDRNHFSHRLVALGFSRTAAVLFIYVVTLTVGLSAFVLQHLDWAGAVVVLAQVILFFLIIYFLERVAKRGSE